MALLEATLLTVYAGQECVNRFYYSSTGEPASTTLSFLLTRGLGAIANAGVYPVSGLMKKIADAVHTSVVFNTLTVKRLYNVTDFYSLPFLEPLTGARSGDGMSPFVALGYRTNRTRSDIRRATKRFAGVSEGDVGQNGVLVAAYVTTVVNALRLALGAVVTETDEGNTVTFSPVVLGKQRYDPDTGLPSPTGRAYRLYPTEAEQLTKLMSGIAWDNYPDVRSQTSRQVGRGR